MHRVLLLDEIVRLVFGYITEQDWSLPGHIEGAPTLNALSRTCRSFMDPALDLLWRQQSTLENLIQCLPHNAYSNSLGGKLTLVQPLYDDDIDRVRYYGRKIKDLGPVESHTHRRQIDPSVFFPIFEKFRILNNLRSLIIPWKLLIDEPCYSTLIMRSAGLHSLTLKLAVPSDKGRSPATFDWEEIANSILQTPSPIKTLTIDAGPSQVYKLERQIPQILYRPFESLEALIIGGGVSWDVLSHLATAQTLRVLEICITSSDLATFLSTTRSKSDFQKLNDLHLTLDDWHRCSELLLRPGFQRLQSLEIASSCGNAEQWDITSFCRALRETQENPTLLRSLRLRHISWGFNQVIPCCISEKTLRPLLCFTNLEYFMLDLGCAVDIDDDALRDVSSSWPKLKMFALCDKQTSTSAEPRITFAGLAALIKSCPLLETISLRINGLSNISLDVPMPVALHLQIFGICTSPVGPDFHAVGALLAKLFPKLQKVGIGWSMWTSESGFLLSPEDLAPQEKEYGRRWTLVNEYLLGPCRGHDSCICKSVSLW